MKYSSCPINDPFSLLSHGHLLRIKGPYHSYQVYFRMSVLTLSYSPVPPPPPLPPHMATTPNQERLLDTGVFAETTSGTCPYYTDHLLAACRNCPPGSQNEKVCKRAREVCVRPRQGYQGGAGLGWKRVLRICWLILRKSLKIALKEWEWYLPLVVGAIKFMYIRHFKTVMACGAPYVFPSWQLRLSNSTLLSILRKWLSIHSICMTG